MSMFASSDGSDPLHASALGLYLKPDSSNDTPASSNGREKSSHVRATIREQFATEVNYKEEELNKIEERIHLAKMMLQRLRLGVLAQHYGAAAFYPTALDYRDETIGAQETWEVFEKEMMSKQETGSKDEGSSQEVEAERLPAITQEEGEEEEEQRTNSSEIESDGPVIKTDDVPMETNCPSPLPWPDDNVKKEDEVREEQEEEVCRASTEREDNSTMSMSEEEGVGSEPVEDVRTISHSYYKKRVIVGNTSQYLDPTGQQLTSSDNASTHKWMVYVRGPQTEADISQFVKAVRFFLHPSYHPNDIVKVRNPPFHLTRLGWGEFPVRVQLEFHAKGNKPVDILHTLVLDRTHTGQQTLGAETIVDLQLMVPPEARNSRLNGFSHPPPLPPPPIDETEVGVPDPSPSLPSSHTGSPVEDMEKSLATPADEPDPWMENDDSADTDPPSSSFGGGGSVLTTNLDRCLHNAVRGLPICGRSVQCEDFFIPAPSLAQYRAWHIGRRRATEWERAVALRKAVERKLKVTSLLSTKKVMKWCRQNGYTPLDPVPANGRGFCKVCGCQLEALDESYEEEEEEDSMEGGSDHHGSRRSVEVHERCQTMMFGKGFSLRGNLLDPFDELRPDTMDTEDSDPPLPKLSSLSQPHDIVAKMLTMQSRLEDRAKGSDEDVDVYQLPPSPSCARSRALVDMVPRFRVPQTPELKWVQQTSSSLGIHIYPAVIDRMYAHVVEHMIYISCARFLRGILGQAVQGAGQRVEAQLSKDRILTPFHIQQAILKLEHCDFLTNRYLGVKPHPCPPTGESEGKANSSHGNTSVTSSSSDSSSDEEEGRG